MPLWKRNFVFVWWNNFVTAIGMMSFLPLLPFYLEEIGVEDGPGLRAWSGVLAAGAPLIAAVMGPIWGAVGDRVGRKLMLLRANAGIVVFVGAMSFADSLWLLLALRCMQGVFSGFIAPAMTLVSVSVPDGRQGRVTALLHTGVLCGGFAGPLLGGWVADSFGLVWVFRVCAGLSVLAMLSTGLFVREPPGLRPRDPARARRTSGLLREVGRQVGGLLRAGPLRAMLISVFAIRFGFSLVEPLLGLFVETLDGWEEGYLSTTTGMVAGATGLATLLMTPASGALGDRIGHRRLLLLSAGGAGIVYLAHALVTTVGVLYVARFVAGLFLAGLMPAAYGLAASASTREDRGGAYGVAFSSMGLAMALGPLCGGPLGALIGLRPLYVLAGLLMLGAFARLCWQKEPEKPPRELEARVEPEVS